MNQFQNQQRPNPMEDLKKFFRDSSILPRLIIINLAVWALVQVAFVFGWAFNRSDLIIEEFIMEYLALPASLEILVYRPHLINAFLFPVFYQEKTKDHSTQVGEVGNSILCSCYTEI